MIPETLLCLPDCRMCLLYYDMLIALAPDRERIEKYANLISPHGPSQL